MSATTRDVRVEDEPHVGDKVGRAGVRKVDGIHTLGILEMRE